MLLNGHDLATKTMNIVYAAGMHSANHVRLPLNRASAYRGAQMSRIRLMASTNAELDSRYQKAVRIATFVKHCRF